MITAILWYISSPLPPDQVWHDEVITYMTAAVLIEQTFPLTCQNTRGLELLLIAYWLSLPTPFSDAGLGKGFLPLGGILRKWRPACTQKNLSENTVWFLIIFFFLREKILFFFLTSRAEVTVSPREEFLNSSLKKKKKKLNKKPKPNSIWE